MRTPSYGESLRRFLEGRAAAHEQRRADLLLRLQKAAKRLTRRFPAITRVAVIGSFVRPELFRTDSDVDIVVSGLSSEEYFDAWLLLEEELEIPLDLIREEEMPHSLRSRLDSELILYAESRVRSHPDAQK